MSNDQPDGVDAPAAESRTRKLTGGRLVAAVVVVLLVLGGVGAATAALMTDQADQPAAADPAAQAAQSAQPASVPESEAGAEQVRQTYMTAYETKNFAPLVGTACTAYQAKYGTDTAETEKQLAPFTIAATPVGAPRVTGGSATAQVALKFSRTGGGAKDTTVTMRLVVESGQWRFCGEGTT